MKSIFIYKTFTVFFLLNISFAFSQTPFFTVIQQGWQTEDSSYYDVCRVSENEFWALGKKGIITSFGNSGTAAIPSFPNSGFDLLNMTLLDEENYLLCGDKGFIYHYRKSSENWEVKQVKGYENSCFYSVCAINQNLAFISGGRSKIASSQRVIPFGFILKTEDGGKTWTEVFKSATSMVWSVQYEPESKQVFALVYTPVKTKLIASSDNGTSWFVKEKRIKGLYHDFKITDGKFFLAGGKNGKYTKNGIVHSGEKIFKFKKTGIFWDVEINEKLALASSTGGNILFKNNSEEWKLIHSPVNNNLYEICFINQNSAFVVGNNKTILKVEFK